jgi:hypothetical protein
MIANNAHARESPTRFKIIRAGITVSTTTMKYGNYKPAKSTKPTLSVESIAISSQTFV